MKNRLLLVIVLILSFTVFLANSQELHTQSNAASIANESDALTGWTGGNPIESVETNDVYQGNYSIKFEAGSDGYINGTYTLATVPNQQYKIVIYAKSANSGAGFYLWSGFSDFVAQNMASPNWTPYEFIVTASGTQATLRVYTGNPSVTGDTAYIDNVSIQEVDNSDPTPPTLSTTGNTDTTVDLNWTGATDDIGVTGYKIYRDGNLINTLGDLASFEPLGLTPSTAYQFHVTALDYYGNESIASNVITVTTNASSNGGSGGYWTQSGSDISYSSGNVGIGTNALSTYKLAIDGNVRAREVRVDVDVWPDYVFEKNYNLPSLEEIAKYIQDNGHLMNVPSAQEVEANGIELGEMNKLLLQKIEELTLYIIKQDKKSEELEQRLNLLKENKN